MMPMSKSSGARNVFNLGSRTVLLVLSALAYLGCGLAAAQAASWVGLLEQAFPGVDPALLAKAQPKDYRPLTLSWARTWGNPNGVEVVFSAPVDAATATNPAHYTIGPGVTVTSARMGTNTSIIQLSTTTLPDGVLHTLTVNGVQDQLTPPNTIPPNSQAPLLKAQGVITRKFFNGITGGNLSDLTNNVRFPNGYDTQDVAAAFESLVNAADNYGVQIHGFVLPPVTGDYSFYIAADNQGVLLLSPDGTPANKVAVATVPSATASRQWSAFTNQQSDYVRLEAGRAYYLEALMKENTGSDNLAVTWRLRGLPAPADGDAPIPGAFLSSMTPSAPVGLAIPPQNQTTVERAPATFAVVASGTPPYGYQWFRSGLPIPGATATNYTLTKALMSDNGATFFVAVSNSFSSVTSSPVTLLVTSDVTAPAIARVSGGATLDRVLVGFTKPVSALTASDPRNYALSGGLAIFGARLLPDQTNVVLTTTAQATGQVYTLTVTGVTDLAATPNAANASSNFTAWVIARGFVRREAFYNLNGGAVSDLLNAPNFPDKPDTADYPVLTEAPNNIGDYSGGRLTGFLLPPSSGYYLFYLATADQGTLYLSTDDSPANKVLIASEPNWASSRAWVSTDRRTAAAPENRSGPIYLQTGRSYYFEALDKDVNGGNSLGFTWQLPGAPMPKDGDSPIPAPYLACLANPVGVSLSITQQPQNRLVLEDAITNFVVGVTSSYSPVFYQWQKNGTDISGANASSYTTPRLLRPDDGARFRCVVSVPGRMLLSDEAVLSVTPDLVPLQALSAATLSGSTNVGVRFNELVDSATAMNPANYTLSTGGAITGVTLRPDGQSVSLTVSTLTFTNFTLAIRNVRDFAGNPIAPTNLTVTVANLEASDIGIAGDPVDPGSTFTSHAGDYDVVASGSDIYNNHDGFHFVYERREGDFDMKVRIARLDSKATYTFAGWHVRENLTAGSRNLKAHLFSTNGANAYHISSRATQDGGSVGNISVCCGPVPYPNAWLRLTRTNDAFTAWRGTNGLDWTSFGQVTMLFTGRVYVGMVACPVNNNAGQATTAWFRDYSATPAPLSPAPRLDLLVKKATDAPSAFVLANQYQTFPAGAQILTLAAAPTNPAAFTVKVDNDGTTNQSFILRASETSESNWAVSYFNALSNITALILGSSGYAVSNLAPGGAEVITVQMLPAGRALGGTTKSTTLRVFAEAYASTLRDAVTLSAVNEYNFQPDLLVRRLSDVVYAGGNVFNDTGSNQTKSVHAEQGARVVYPLQLLNTGNATNYFKVRGSAGTGGWSVRYFDAVNGGSEITDDVTGDGSVVTLIPNGFWECRAEIMADLSVPDTTTNTVLVRAISTANADRRDTVQMLTITKVATNAPQSRLYTLDSDFEEGTLIGTAYGGGQLTLSERAVVPPYIWVPNSDSGTVSKVDVRTGKEVARYRTCPPGVSGQPSRTTVDQYGNCWVANRNSGTVVKIGLYETGQYLDRNGDGVIQTSTDLNNDGDITGAELLPWGSDECVLWEVAVIPGKEGTYVPGTYGLGYVNAYWSPGPRGIGVDEQGNVWAGTHDTMRYFYLDNASARILRTNDVLVFNHTAYGAVIDPQGILWSSGYKDSGQCNVLRYDPVLDSNYVINIEFHTYGLGLDRSNHLFVSGHQEAKLTRINTLTGVREWTVNAGYLSRGVAVTDDGDVWVVSSSEGNVWRFSNDGVFKSKIAVGNTPTGVSVDSEGKVWVVNNGDEYIHRIDPATETVITTKRIIGGVHYGYSDMTGVISRRTTARFGTWTIVQDSRVEQTAWGRVTWTSFEPNNNNITVRARSSRNQASWSNWEIVTNGVLLSATPPGQYLQVEVAMRSLVGQDLPALYDLLVEPLAQRTADLAVTQTAMTGPVTNTYQVTWAITVTNLGPEDARGVILTNELTPFMRFLSATSSQGGWVQSPGVIRWDVGNLAAGTNATLSFLGEVNAVGRLTNVVRLKHYEIDLVPENNRSVLVIQPYSLACLAPPAGLAAWWQGEGNPNDTLGLENGVASGLLTYVPGMVGQALSFNGVDAHMMVPASTNVNVGASSLGMTIELWIKPGDLVSRPLLEWNRVNNAWGAHFWTSVPAYGGGVGSIYANLSDTARADHPLSTPPGILVSNVWQHVALTYDRTNGTAKFYCNGTNVATLAAGTFFPQTSAELYLGLRQSSTGAGTRWLGQMDEVALYKRPLAAAEIKALFQAGYAGKCSGSDRPLLTITRTSPASCVLTWPDSAANYKLETAPALGGAWREITDQPQHIADQYVLPVQVTPNTQFYRLRKP